jgi:hypothetical protein
MNISLSKQKERRTLPDGTLIETDNFSVALNISFDGLMMPKD